MRFAHPTEARALVLELAQTSWLHWALVLEWVLGTEQAMGLAQGLAPVRGLAPVLGSGLARQLSRLVWVQH